MLSTGPGHSILIRNGGKTARFTFTAGLGVLFSRAGCLRTKASAASQALPREDDGLVSPCDSSYVPCDLLLQGWASDRGGTLDGAVWEADRVTYPMLMALMVMLGTTVPIRGARRVAMTLRSLRLARAWCRKHPLLKPRLWPGPSRRLCF